MNTEHSPGEADASEVRDQPKPTILYHASAHRQIAEFLPRNLSVRDPSEGPGVFATPDKAIAAIFMVPTDDSWVASGKHNGVPYILISDRRRFTELDHGGAIYELPSDSFVNDSHKGLGYDEWFSAQPVTPTAKTEYDSGLQTMLDQGVQVYFADPATFQAARAADDHGYQILKRMVSENMQRGLNVREF